MHALYRSQGEGQGSGQAGEGGTWPRPSGTVEKVNISRRENILRSFESLNYVTIKWKSNILLTELHSKGLYLHTFFARKFG